MIGRRKKLYVGSKIWREKVIVYREKYYVEGDGTEEREILCWF